MQYLVVYSNGKSQSFYNETLANTYKTINGGFVVNLMDSESLDNSEDLSYTVSTVTD